MVPHTITHCINDDSICESTVESSCVGDVYTPVGCRDPVYNSAAYMWLAQKIGNWVTTDDWCVHTVDTTQLDFVVGKLFRLVETRRDCRQLVANLIHTADATQLNSWVASASAVCIGLKGSFTLTRIRANDHSCQCETALIIVSVKCSD